MQSNPDAAARMTELHRLITILCTSGALPTLLRLPWAGTAALERDGRYVNPLPLISLMHDFCLFGEAPCTQEGQPHCAPCCLLSSSLECKKGVADQAADSLAGG